MSKQERVSIGAWTEKSRKLLGDVKRLFHQIGCDESGIPQEVFEGDKPLSLVFAGQYSAGKSSIIRALTGIEDIAVGAGITTQVTHTYDWNGIEVIDTPGIHTTLRPDHDEISYQAIANSDMLVYVVTQELFDDFIGQNFRKLLCDKDKAGEMILVVNKMADIGNTVENQEIKLSDLEKVTRPYTPAQLRTVFVDAESYLDSLTETDIEIAEELRVRSNYEALVETINAFVRDKGIASRMTTVLYRLIDIIEKALLEYQPSTGDGDVDALEENLMQERRIILNTRWRIETSVKSIVGDAASKIRETGREIANSIYDCSSEDEANNMIDDACRKVEKITAACEEEVVHSIEKLSEDGQAQLNELFSSDFVQNLKIRFENKEKKGNPVFERLIKSNAFYQGGSKMVSGTIGSNVAAGGLKAFSGSNVHQTVLKVGHFFGHRFKPWEAIKVTKGINAAGKAIGAIGVVFSFGMQVKEDIDADNLQQEMKKNRQNVRAAFDNAAHETEKFFTRALNDFLSNNYNARVQAIESEISEISEIRTGKSETCQKLESARKNCSHLIAEIHQNPFDFSE